MPIRPKNQGRYPPNWRAISAYIRFVRAAARCECDGRCGRRHHGRCTARHGRPHPVTGSNVVLTTAHLDDVPENCREDNLLAMCQACHLAYDARLHAATADRSRYRALIHPDQTELFDLEDT